MRSGAVTLFVIASEVMLGACFDPIVGTDCASEGLADCDGYCVPVAEATAECSLPTCEGETCSPACTGDDCIEPPSPFGHVVLIGHDYTLDGDNETAAQILGNAVFMARGQHVAVAEYTGSASPVGRDKVHTAIDRMADELGRGWDKVVEVAGAELGTTLDTVDVFMIHSQRAPGVDDELGRLGRAWQSELERFLARGGIVILLDGATSRGRTVQIVAAAGLVGYERGRRAASAELTLSDPTDAISVGVPDRYRSNSAIRFEGADEGAVVSDGVGAVVAHLVY